MQHALPHAPLEHALMAHQGATAFHLSTYFI